MAGYAKIYSAAFALYSMMEVLGLMPQEVRSAGITLTGLFNGYYGDQVSTYVYTCTYIHVMFMRMRYCVCVCVFQNVDFVSHHIKRTTVTILLHLLLPLVYCMGLGLVEPEWGMVIHCTTISLSNQDTTLMCPE